MPPAKSVICLPKLQEEQTTDAVSDVIAHQFTDTHNVLIHRVIHHLNDLLYETIKPYYFQNSSRYNKSH